MNLKMAPLLVAAIDFGTTYSGWAFSFRHEYDRDPTKVSAKNWTGGQLVSQKGPTCVLIKPDGKTLDTFGYEAESKYAELALDGEHKDWFFFKRFKMMLFNPSGIKRNVMLEDSTNKKLPAKTVFKLAIEYLKEDLIKTSQKTIGDGGLTNDDIHWVLTVPAIWDDAAKQFMRESAQDAGISGDKLTICLEPEAASVFCRHLPVEKSVGREKASLASFKAGTKYMIIDAGGGTVDITVHEIMANGDLRELHKASGGAWGGTKVDEAFEKLLGSIFGEAVVGQFKENHIEDFIELFRDFEIKKREISPSKDTKMTIRIPRTFFDLVEDSSGCSIKDWITKTKYGSTLSVIGDKIRFDANIARACFEDTINSTVSHVETLFKESSVAGCSAVLMVGGFSESAMLQEAIQNKFGRLKIIIPQEAGLAVLKGAVIYGHKPFAIAERVCKYTYGDKVLHAFIGQCSHPPGRKETGKDGKVYCCDLFNIHVKVGQAVKIGEATTERITTPMYDDQTGLHFEIFASHNPNPIFVTEYGCKCIGALNVSIPDTSMGMNRSFGTSFIFGGTEIRVKVVDKATGKTTIEAVDFLE